MKHAADCAFGLLPAAECQAEAVCCCYKELTSCKTASPEAHLGCLAGAQVLQDLHRGGGRQVLVVGVAEALHALGVVRHRDHGPRHAAAHALHLAQREHAVLQQGLGSRMAAFKAAATA